MIDPAMKKELQKLIDDQITSRNKSTRHANDDHLDRALIAKKIKPGTKGQVLSTDGTDTTWKPKYAIGRMYLSAGATFANNVEKLLDNTVGAAWTQEYETDASVVDVDVANYRIYARRTGYYRVSAQAQWSVPGSFVAGYMSVKNSGGGYVLVGSFQSAASAAYPPGSSASDVILLGAGDYVEMRCWWNYAGGPAVYDVKASSRWGTWMSMEYIGDQ